MRIFALAKINWTLDITGQREDGYHLMDMLMQPVSLHDVVTLTAAPEIALTTSGNPLLPPDERHLALRAARALKAHTGYEGGAAIHVHKRIPVGAGMGGGSSDAAAVLAGLNRLWQTGLGQQELEAIGLTLGADVPFCLRGGLTRTTGIGEEMEDLPCGRYYPLVVIQPCRGLSTKEVFTAYHEQTDTRRPDTLAAMAALKRGDAAPLPDVLANVMQPVSEARRDGIRDAIAALKAQPGAITALMTGSGSAVYGVFSDNESAAAAAELLRQQWKKTFLCHTRKESLVFADEDHH